MMNIKYINYDSLFSKVSVFYSYIFLGICILLPVFILIFLLCFFDKLEIEYIKQKFDALYLDLRTESKHQTIFYILFLLRRLLFSYSLVFLDNYSLFQIFINQMTSLMMIFYVVKTNPFTDKLLYLQEIFNEITIFFVITLHIGFTSALNYEDLKYLIGWNIIGL